MKHTHYYKCTTLCILMLLLDLMPICAREANKYKIDSLKTILNKTIDEPARLSILEAIYKSTLCSDKGGSFNCVNEYLAIAGKLHDLDKTEKAMVWMGLIHSECEQNFGKAIHWFTKADSIAALMENTKEQAYVLSMMASAYEGNMDYARAIKSYRKSLDLDNSADKAKGILGNMGSLYSNTGDYPSAAECFEKSYKIQYDEMISGKKCTRNDTMNMIGILVSLADVDVAMSQFENALKNYALAYSYNIPIKDEFVDLMVSTGMGKCFQARDDYDSAIQNYETALSISRKIRMKENESDILNRIGNVYLATGNTAKALEYAKQSLKISDNNTSSFSLPGGYLLLGKIYAVKKNFRAAVSNLKKAINLYNKAGQMNEESTAWLELSTTFEKMNNNVAALDAYKRHISLRDCIFNLDKTRQLTMTEMNGVFERKEAADSVRRADEKKIVRYEMQRQRVLVYSGFGGVALMLLLAFFIYRNYNQEKKANVTITAANKAIIAEKLVSETLLLNILPVGVADELKANGKVKACLFEDVSVLMTDFVDFTLVAERLSPEDLVAELHYCFEAFDNIVGKYHIEKIKTVGDAYVAVAGLPYPNARHAEEIILAAIEIRDFINHRKKEKGNDTFGIRIGINSGKLVAGIVGVKKFAYDVWGDTVNTAARMEQSGEEGKINISDDTHRLVKDRFVCTYRGEIDAKNKGKLKMYFVDSQVL